MSDIKSIIHNPKFKSLSEYQQRVILDVIDQNQPPTSIEIFDDLSYRILWNYEIVYLGLHETDSQWYCDVCPHLAGKPIQRPSDHRQSGSHRKYYKEFHSL